MFRILGIFAGLMGIAAACTTVDGARILGGDLARADSRFQSLPPEVSVGLAPSPGAQRVLDTPYLAGVARRYGLAEEAFKPVCFERPTEVLSESRLQSTLESLAGPGTQLEILDFSRYPVPHGELVFSVSDLPRLPPGQQDTPVVWRGRIRYDARASAAVWASVRVRKLEHWVVATRDVPAHKTIAAGDVELKSGWRSPFSVAPVSEPDRAIGKQALRSLQAGTVLMPGMLAEPNDVERGDMVDIRVLSGAVSLRLAGRAETGGHRNDTVVVYASDLGRRLRARVEGKGKVQISADFNPKMALGPPVLHGANRPVDAFGRGREAQVEGSGAGVPAGQVSH